MAVNCLYKVFLQDCIVKKSCWNLGMVVSAVFLGISKEERVLTEGITD